MKWYQTKTADWRTRRPAPKSSGEGVEVVPLGEYFYGDPIPLFQGAWDDEGNLTPGSPPWDNTIVEWGYDFDGGDESTGMPPHLEVYWNAYHDINGQRVEVTDKLKAEPVVAKRMDEIVQSLAEEDMQGPIDEWEAAVEDDAEARREERMLGR